MAEISPRDWQPEGPSSRIRALATYLDVPREDIEPPKKHGNIYRTGGQEYLVLTRREADLEVVEYIRETLWTFKPSFIIHHTNLPEEAEEMIELFVDKKQDDANDTIKALIVDFPKFVDEAIRADGRGHFLSPYDGEEGHVRGFFIYRIQ